MPSTKSFPVTISEDSVNNQWWARYSAGATIEDIREASGAPTDWVHLAFVVSKTADTVKLFVDGTQLGSTQTGLGTFVGIVDEGYIGAADNLQNNAWDGAIAHVAVWDTPLNDSQIASLASV